MCPNLPSPHTWQGPIPQRGKLCISWLLPPSQTIPSQYNSVQKKEGKLILESPTFFEVFCTFNTSQARDGLLSAELPIRTKLRTRLQWRQCNFQIIALTEEAEVEILCSWIPSSPSAQIIALMEVSKAEEPQSCSFSRMSLSGLPMHPHGTSRRQEVLGELE